MESVQEFGIADKLSKQITDFAVSTRADLEDKLAFTKTEVDKLVADKLAAKDIEINEKFSALEAKLSTGAPAIVKTQSSRYLADNDRRIAEKLRNFTKGNPQDRDCAKVEIKLYEDEAHKAQCDLEFTKQDFKNGMPVLGHDASLKEKLTFASTLTGGGDNRGGRVEYSPFRVSQYLGNTLAPMVDTISTQASSWTWRFKYGLSGYQWGETVDQTNTRGNTTTVAWALPLKDFNCRFDVRTIYLDDTNWMGGDFEGVLTRSISFDQEAGSFEGLAMHLNNDQSGTGTTVVTGGADGPRSLCGSYPINGSPAYAGGQFTPAAWASGATVSTNNGLVGIATLDQLVTNAAGNTSNISLSDINQAMNLLPQQYWQGAMKDSLAWYIHPLQASALRVLRDNNQTPVFDRVTPGIYPGYIGDLMGIPVITSRYLHQPTSQTTTAGTTSLFPIYLANWKSFATIVRSLTFSVKRFTETNPGSVTYFADTRSQFSISDVFSGIRIRTSAVASAYTVNALNPGQ